MNYESGKYKNIHYGDILIKLPTLVDCDNILLPFVNDNIFISPKLNLLKTGDIVIADTAEDYTAGKAIEIKNKSSRVISGLHTISCRPNFEFYNGYLGYYLNSFTFRKNLLPLIQGIKVFSVSKYMYNFLFINYPSVMEQKKITNLLLNIDARIQTQNKIINNLYSQKKYLKSIIFRNDISNHKIGDFLEEYTEKNVKNYEPVSVGKYGIRKRTEIFSRELSEDYSKNKVIHKDSLTIGMGTKEIDIAILFEDYHYCVSPAYTTYKIKNIDSYYFNELLDSLNYLLSLRYMISGARQGKSVNKKELMNHQIYVHTTEQQSVIKNLLKSVDNKIDNETKLLEKYSQQKNYLLNNLFI